MKVELVYVGREREELLELDVKDGSTADDLIQLSAIADRFPDDHLESAPIGIWGIPVEREHRLREGDRLEIYRPLQMDPREARLQRVKE